MKSFTVILADIPIKVNCLYGSTYSFCKEYLSDKNFCYEITINEKDIDNERKLSNHVVSDNYLETLALYRKIAELLIDEDVILFHSSAIEVDGNAYLFAAPSGTGKSTHTKLWRELLTDKEVHMVNDDKPLLRIKDKEITVYGTPWNGRKHLSENRNAPVRGICFVSQGKENQIGFMKKEDIFPKMLKQTYRSTDKEKLSKTLNMLKQCVEIIPIYEMSCNISLEAAEMSYKFMTGKGR